MRSLFIVSRKIFNSFCIVAYRHDVVSINFVLMNFYDQRTTSVLEYIFILGLDRRRGGPNEIIY